MHKIVYAQEDSFENGQNKNKKKVYFVYAL